MPASTLSLETWLALLYMAALLSLWPLAAGLAVICLAVLPARGRA